MNSPNLATPTPATNKLTAPAVLAITAACLAWQPSALHAGTTDIAPQPLATTSAVHAKPNLMFILDDSGSMGWGYMPDDIPIMGPSGKVSGLFYAFGFCGHGFQIGPGVGLCLSEMIVDGSTPMPT